MNRSPFSISGSHIGSITLREGWSRPTAGFRKHTGTAIRQQIRQPPAARWPRATQHLHTACTRCPLLTPVHPRGPHTNTRPATLCLGAHVMTCEVAAEAASRQLHAEHLHPMRSGAGARRTSATASAASLPAILRRLAASHHHWPPLRATASSECQGQCNNEGTWWVHHVLIRKSFPDLSHMKEHQKLI